MWTWEKVTYDQLKAILREECASKITQVSEVLLQFGPTHLKKTPEMSVAKFTHNWLEQLLECMTSAATIDDLKKFADLIKRSLYCYCLEDQFIQKELCELSEADNILKNSLTRHA